MKTLHIAPLNTAGFPYDFHRMFAVLGGKSKLITMYKNIPGFSEDICLNLYLPQFKLARSWRKLKEQKKKNSAEYKSRYFKPANILEASYFFCYGRLLRPRINKLIRDENLDEYDVIFYHGGMDFTRDSFFAKRWKQMGKKIICCYYGSDLRIRGIIKEMELLSDLEITAEFDHLSLKENLQFIQLPFFIEDLPVRNKINDGKIRIVHSPTDRKYKGTDLIIHVIEKLKKSYDNIEFVLLENKPRAFVLKKKAEADICIDQVGGIGGGTGYGKSGLESIALGIPTLTSMNEDYAEFIENNAFIVVNNAEELEKQLGLLIKDEDIRTRSGYMSKKWFEDKHSPEAIFKKISNLLEKYDI